MGTETIGPDKMIAGAEGFGFNAKPPIDLPAPVASSFPTDFRRNLPALAQSSIGQNDVQATPAADGAGRGHASPTAARP